MSESDDQERRTGGKPFRKFEKRPQFGGFKAREGGKRPFKREGEAPRGPYPFKRREDETRPASGERPAGGGDRREGGPPRFRSKFDGERRGPSSGDAPRPPFRKPFGKPEGGGFRRPEGGDGERRPFNREERPRFGGGDRGGDSPRPYRKPFGKPEGGGFRRPEGGDGERRPFNREERPRFGGGDRGGDSPRPYRKPFGKPEGGGFRRPEGGDGERRPFNRGERPRFGGGDRGGERGGYAPRKPFRSDAGGFERPREFRGHREEGGESRPFRKPFQKFGFRRAEDPGGGDRPARFERREGAPEGAENPRAEEGGSRPSQASLLFHGAQVLRRVRDGDLPADRALSSFFFERRTLGSHDRRFIAETFYHLMRHHRRIDEAIQMAFTGKFIAEERREIGFPVSDPSAAMRWHETTPGRDEQPSVIGRWMDLMRFGLASAERFREEASNNLGRVAVEYERLGQDRFYEQVSVQLLGHLLESAVDKMRELGDNDSPSLADRTFSFPGWMWGMLGFGLPKAEWMPLGRSLNEPAPITLRFNSLATDLELSLSSLREAGIDAQPAPLAPQGIILPGRVATPSVPYFNEGWFEFQDEASQLAVLFCGAAPGMRVVDACAGAGGKTLYLAERMENTGTVLACDIDERRLAALHKRVERAAVTIVEPQRLGSSEPFGEAGSADIVLLDAPCSGSGTLRRSPDRRWRLQQNDLPEFLRTQAGLLDRWAPLVKPGGVLVYATCSLFNDENKAQIEAFLARNDGFERDPEGAAAALGAETAAKVLDREGDLVLYPHRQGTDGFYAARLKRRG
ncbi:MAG: SAM-dependent methyltransferase [Candidatus Sumerlaeia bacterium]|nr:SAM-dependent methyltransferase [Candidatus Sumerlaeia bacterium]